MYEEWALEHIRTLSVTYEPVRARTRHAKPLISSLVRIYPVSRKEDFCTAQPNVQYSFNESNTDSSFTAADANLFESLGYCSDSSKYLHMIFYYIMKTYVFVSLFFGIHLSLQLLLLCAVA